jgi:hypothetical protein
MEITKERTLNDHSQHPFGADPAAVVDKLDVELSLLACHCLDASHVARATAERYEADGAMQSMVDAPAGSLYRAYELLQEEADCSGEGARLSDVARMLHRSKCVLDMAAEDVTDPEAGAIRHAAATADYVARRLDTIDHL